MQHWAPHGWQYVPTPGLTPTTSWSPQKSGKQSIPAPNWLKLTKPVTGGSARYTVPRGLVRPHDHELTRNANAS